MGSENELTRPIKGKEAAVQIVIAAVVIGLGLWRLSGSSDEKAAPAPAKPQPARVDFSKPLFTTEEGVICPIDRAFDQRMGHSLKDATQAALQTFGRTEALRDVGCEVVHDGVPVFAKPPASDDVAWLEGTTSAVFYWRFNLRN